MSKLNTTPTGCPGPIPGTKVWRCDGENCVYGAVYYASCKEAIAERGYTLRLSSDLVEEAAEAARLIEQNVQSALAAEQADKMRIIKNAEAMDKEYRAKLTTQMFKTDAQQDIADEFANLYYEQMMLKESCKDEFFAEIELNGLLMRTNADLRQDIDSQCEHCATLLQHIAELEDELLYYKQVEAQRETTDGSRNTDAGDSAGSDGAAVPDASSDIGNVSE